MSISIPFALKGEYKSTVNTDGKETEKTNKIDFQMPFAYNRLTTDGVVDHIITQNVVEDGETKLSVRARFTMPDENTLNAVIGVLVGSAVASLRT